MQKNKTFKPKQQRDTSKKEYKTRHTNFSTMTDDQREQHLRQEYKEMAQPNTDNNTASKFSLPTLVCSCSHNAIYSVILLQILKTTQASSNSLFCFHLKNCYFLQITRCTHKFILPAALPAHNRDYSPLRYKLQSTSMVTMPTKPPYPQRLRLIPTTIPSALQTKTNANDSRHNATEPC